MARAKTGALTRHLPKSTTYTTEEFCKALGKSSAYVRRLQSALSLPIPRRQDRYPQKYLLFMRRIISLRTFLVTIDEIHELIEKEQKILQLLHFDSVMETPYWYMAENHAPVPSDHHLLLTGIPLDFRLSGKTIQCHLDFKERERELFGRQEMGEDVRRVIDLYQRLLQRIDARVMAEKVVMMEALAWAGRSLVFKEPDDITP